MGLRKHIIYCFWEEKLLLDLIFDLPEDEKELDRAGALKLYLSCCAFVLV